MDKKNLNILIMIMIGLLLFPFLLNWILRQDAIFPIVGDSVTWLNFWPTYLSAVASLGMIILTYYTLKQNQEQMIRFEKQREEENRARISASIIAYEKAYYVKLKNIGKTDASKVRIKVNQDFIDTISGQFQRIFQDLENPFYIEVDRPVYLYIGWCEDINEEYKDKDITVKLSGSYYSGSTKYPFEEELRVSEFVNKLHFEVRGDLETTMDHIKRRLIVQNDFHHPIQISLENIEKSLKTLVRQNKEYVEKITSSPTEEVDDCDDVNKESSAQD